MTATMQPPAPTGVFVVLTSGARVPVTPCYRGTDKHGTHHWTGRVHCLYEDLAEIIADELPARTSLEISGIGWGPQR